MPTVPLPPLSDWDALDEPEAQRLAREVATAAGAELVELGWHELSGCRHRVARYDVDGVCMALVPGGRVRLGPSKHALPSTLGAAFAARRDQLCAPHTPHAVNQLRDVDATAPPVPTDLSAWLTGKLSPARTVALAPFLIEIDALMVDDLLCELDEEAIGELGSHAALCEVTRAQGFRLPSPDEWELAAGGGRSTWFRWGDDWPTDSHPVDGGPFTLHRAPNALSLLVTDDPYQPEVTGDPHLLKGGDAGSLVHAGTPAPLCWLSFATAFTLHLPAPETGASAATEHEIYFEEARVRRVKTLEISL